VVEQRTFNPLVGSSTLLRPTRNIKRFRSIQKSINFQISANLGKSNQFCGKNAVQFFNR
jgi:hypothetical protein